MGAVLDFVLVFIVCVLSSLGIILTRKRELVALLSLSVRCLVTVNCFVAYFLIVMQFVNL